MDSVADAIRDTPTIPSAAIATATTATIAIAVATCDVTDRLVMWKILDLLDGAFWGRDMVILGEWSYAGPRSRERGYCLPIATNALVVSVLRVARTLSSRRSARAWRRLVRLVAPTASST
jgi:hypothetical protein